MLVKNVYLDYMFKCIKSDGERLGSVIHYETFVEKAPRLWPWEGVILYTLF